MVRFTLFGVPVEIQPWFWLAAALFSGTLDSLSPDAMQHGLIFMLAATLSILVHEFGHALTGLRLGGGRANIVLWFFGGLAYNQGGRFTKSGDFWRIAAGPGAGFILGGLVLLIMVAIFGLQDAARLAGASLFRLGLDFTSLSDETLAFVFTRLRLMSLFSSMLEINFWWGVINLLPVLPLDGGQIAKLFVAPQKKVHQISLVAAAATAVVALLWRGSMFMPLMFGYLAWKNYKDMKEYHWQ